MKKNTNKLDDRPLTLSELYCRVSSFSHEGFIKKLEELGFEIKIYSADNGGYNPHLQVNGLSILGEKYPFFWLLLRRKL